MIRNSACYQYRLNPSYLKSVFAQGQKLIQFIECLYIYISWKRGTIKANLTIKFLKDIRFNELNNLLHLRVNASSSPIKTPPTSTPTAPSLIPTKIRFSPKINGFQFGNDIPKETISYWDALNQLNSTSNSVNWKKPIPPQLKSSIALFSVGVHRLQLGNCFGMSYTAKYYYEHQDQFSSHFLGVENMYQVRVADISSEIIANQFPGQETTQPYLLNLMITYYGLNDLNDEAQWIMHELDNYKVVQLYLTKRNIDPFFFHSVLIFDYEITEKTIIFDVYDPNHSGETRRILLTKDQKGKYLLNPTGTMDDVLAEYSLTNIGAGEYTNVDWRTVASHMNNSTGALQQFLPEIGGPFIGIKWFKDIFL